jgi:cob(I)alamin adenosyltransferase
MIPAIIFGTFQTGFSLLNQEQNNLVKDLEVMRLFSGKGDSGFTTLFDGKKIAKDHQILNIIGNIDEATAFIGLAISTIEHKNLRQDLCKSQEHLSNIMGVFSGSNRKNWEDEIEDSIKWLESKISFYGKGLDKPKSFTFPGETTEGAVLDICRTIIRRIERLAVGYHRKNQNPNTKILAYINRLSSFFYVLRRHVDEKIDSSI